MSIHTCSFSPRPVTSTWTGGHFPSFPTSSQFCLQPHKSSVPLPAPHAKQPLFLALSTLRHSINFRGFNFYKHLKESLSREWHRYSSSDRHPMNDIFLNLVPGSLGFKSERETKFTRKKHLVLMAAEFPHLAKKKNKPKLILPYKNLKINED